MPAVLISGASRGIGRATALRLAASGWDVYATVRTAADGAALRADGGERIRIIELDVTDEPRLAALADELPERLDAIVNNAGIVVSGPLESVSATELQHQFGVNVVGAVALTNQVLPKLRESRGRILFLSSLSGRISTPMTGAYNASKFAIEAIADAWRLELRPWGIAVVLIEPAMTDTDLWRRAPEALADAEGEMSAAHRELYAGHLEGMRRAIPRIQKMAKPVDGVAATIERALLAKRPRARYLVGADVKVQAAVAALTPTALGDRLTGAMLGMPPKSR